MADKRLEYASAIRKNPFPSVAHAANLGDEVLRLTVETRQFRELLAVVTSQEAQGEPLGIVALGSAGAGKTHFLKFLEHRYKPASLAWSRGPDGDPEGEPHFHQVAFVPNPGSSFSDLVQRLVRCALDPVSLRRLVDRLISLPAVELCLEKASRNEAKEANEKVALRLRKHPEEIEAYWSRFSKSEIYNAAHRILSQVSRHPTFEKTFGDLLRARGENMPIDYEVVVNQLAVRWSRGSEEGDRSPLPSRDFEAVQIAESVLALVDVLEVRVLLLFDECQVVLNGEDRVAGNALFRQLVNATPRGSVMVFALRTEDWVNFADDATDRRVRYTKIKVSQQEAWEIILTHIALKGGNPHLGLEEARRLFPESVAKRLWSESNGVVGRVLALCFDLHRRITEGPSELSMDDAVSQVLAEAQGPAPRPRGPREAESVEDILLELASENDWVIRPGTRGFDLEIYPRGEPGNVVFVAMVGANNDLDEARRARALAEEVLARRGDTPGFRIVLLARGYQSLEVRELLAALVDQLVIADSPFSMLRQEVESALRSLLGEPAGGSSSTRPAVEGTQLLGELSSIERRRRVENARTLKRDSETSREPLPFRVERVLRQSWPLLVAASLAAVITAAGVGYFSLNAGEGLEARLRTALNDLVSGNRLEQVMALDSLDSLVEESSRRDSARICRAVDAYLRAGTPEKLPAGSEAKAFLSRNKCQELLP